MFKAITGFVSAFFSIPLGWRMWVGLLTLVNAVIPLFLIQSQEARFTLAAFVLSLFIGLILFSYQGFTRLLGFMHFPWVLLVFYLAGTIVQTSPDTFFGVWVRVVVLVNSAALVLDVFDVFRYISGERKSTIGL